VSQAARSTEQRLGPQKVSAQTDRGATHVTLARGGAGAKRQGDRTGRAQRRRRGGNSARDRKSLRMRPVEVERPRTGSGDVMCRHCLAHPPPLLADVAATQCGEEVGRSAGRPPPLLPPPSGYPPEPKSERWQFASPLSTRHTHAREVVRPGGGVGRLAHQTARSPPAAGRQPTLAHTGTRRLPCAAGSVRRSSPGPSLASLATPQWRKEPRIGRFSAGPARLPSRFVSQKMVRVSGRAQDLS